MGCQGTIGYRQSTGELCSEVGKWGCEGISSSFPRTCECLPFLFLLHRLVHLKSNSTRIYCNITVSWFLGTVYYCVFIAPKSELAAWEGVAIAKAILSFSCRIVFTSSQHSGKHASFSSIAAAIFKRRCLNLLASGSVCVCLIGAEHWLTHRRAEAWAPRCAWDHVLLCTIRSNHCQSRRCQFFGSVISTSRYYEKHSKMKTVAVSLTRRIV